MDSPKPEDDKIKDPYSVLTAVSFAVSFILIGLPLWWKTTNVYRVSLPYDDIENLSSLQVTHVIPVTVILTDRNVQQGALFEELYLLSNEGSDGDNSQPRIEYTWKLRTALEEEENAIQQSTNVQELDFLLEKVSKIKEVGGYHIHVLENRNFNSSVHFVGCHRRAYISNYKASHLEENIISVVRTLVHENLLKKIYRQPKSYERKRPEKDRMRSLAVTTTFDVTFTLIVPEPHIINVNWDIERAINAYIRPLLAKMSSVATVDVKSQILYMMSLPVKASLRGENGENYLSEEKLPSIINAVEGKLGCHASMNPTLNFITYIPPKMQFPLYIIDHKGELVETNAFLSPQWGGFVIKNIGPVHKNTSLPYDVNLNMREVMEIFLGQLKLLLGLPDMHSMDNASVEMEQSPRGCEWELDYLLRKNTQEQLSSAASSLYSLGALLQTISNIVIQDDIGEKIFFALSSIHKSCHALQEGFLEAAFIHSKDAFNASEAAFFDPSLLAFLYFPEDQKYAIYIPLFLPVSIPVIMSIHQIWTFWIAHKAKKIKAD